VVEVVVDYHPRLHGKPSSANFKNVKRALVDMGTLWLELHGAPVGAAARDRAASS
jgi:hypothetical protein